MKLPTLLPLMRNTFPDGTIVAEGESAECRVVIRLRPDVFADPRLRHILPKLFAAIQDEGEVAA